MYFPLFDSPVAALGIGSQLAPWIGIHRAGHRIMEGTIPLSALVLELYDLLYRLISNLVTKMTVLPPTHAHRLMTMLPAICMEESHWFRMISPSWGRVRGDGDEMEGVAEVWCYLGA